MKRRMGSVKTLFSCMLLIGLVTSLAVAQLPTASVQGRISDASGAVIPGVEITVRSTETGATRTGISGENGEFRFVALPVGNYEVRAELAGFQSQVRSGVSLAVGQDAVINFALQVGAIAETVEVTAEAPLVNTTSGSLGTLVDERQVADLPLNGRNYTDLTLLQPGVVAHRSGNQSMSNPGTMFSANGAPLRSNNYLLDGAMMGGAKDSSSASVGHTSLGVEGIREWRVVTNSFSAEYGMRMGAQMTLVSKGGSNEVHGSLFEYHRNSALDARNFFDYKSPTNQRRLPAFTRNQWGGSIGGPIVKDKLFYFGTYEALKERLGLTNIINVPGAGCHGPAGGVITNAACPQMGNVSSVTINPVIAPFLAIYPNPNLPNNQYTYTSSQSIDQQYAQGRADWIINENDSFFVRYTGDSASRAEPLGFPEFAREGKSFNQFITFSESHTFSPVFLGTFRMSYSRPRANILSNQPFTGSQYAFISGKPIGGISVTNLTGYGPDSRTPNNNTVNLYTWSADMFYTKGTQTLKFGVLSNVDNIFFDNANFERGSVSFPDLASFLGGNYTSYEGLAPEARGIRNLSYQTWGFYLQDDWQAHRNLTLNLGFRYEFHTNISERNGQMSAVRDILNSKGWTVGPFFQNPSTRAFSPRLGFAWDIMGNGRTSLRGGAGLIYDIGAIGGYLSFVGNRLPPFNPQQLEDIPGTLRSIPLTFRPFTITGSESITGISFDYNLRNPHMMHYNLTLERELPFGMAMSVAYAGSRGFNLLGSREGNPPLPSGRTADGRPTWTGTEGRLNPNLGQVDRETAAFSSWYNSLQFSVQKRLSRGLQFQSNYTWGKLIDEKGGVTGAESGGSGAMSSPIYRWRVGDRGRADWDVAHSWRFNTIYHFPATGLQGFAGGLVNGWWMSGIVQAQTGLPFTPTTSGAVRGAIGIPDVAPGRTKESIMKGVSTGCPGVAAGTPLGTPQRWFDPCGFVRAPTGAIGNVGRNTLVGPGVMTLDMSLVKDTPLRGFGESGAIQFRAEVFNILNKANFSRPNRNVFTARGTNLVPATAAQITATDTKGREVQFALKLIW